MPEVHRPAPRLFVRVPFTLSGAQASRTMLQGAR